MSAAAPRRTLAAIGAAAGQADLAIMGACHPAPDTAHLPHGTGTLVLLGPSEPGFWPRVQTAPEFHDGRPDPLDRWSARVITALADRLGATAFFPFEGPPYLPFQDWALQTGAFWSSPIRMLVHRDAGLLISIRGALAFDAHMELDTAAQSSPCLSCHARACLNTCPVNALSETAYDLAACHDHLDTPEGAECLDRGCLARRSCPVSLGYPRHPGQSAFHMAAFHRTR